MSAEHPFAPIIRILGRGPSFVRDLTEAEAETAFAMILREQVEPIQTGAFLMLMRFKGEKPAELAGFVRAVRSVLDRPAHLPAVDLDWPSYAAGRTRGLPFYVLSALLLAENGVKVLMHGSNSYQSQGQPSGRALEYLGVAPSASLMDAAERLGRENIAYVALESFCPRLQEILDLRPLLGLRSPANTIARAVNPFEAACSVIGVFHPVFRDIHQEAARLLGQQALATLKGGGGEFERNPFKSCSLRLIQNGELADEEWPAVSAGAEGDDAPATGDDLSHLAALWRGDSVDVKAVATVIGTAAVVLKTMGRAADFAEAEAMAAKMWESRPKRKYGA